MKGHEDDGMFFGTDEALPGMKPGAFGRILRKEVIQPQVPLRLPCYDLVPIREFILDASVLAVRSAA